MIKNNVAPVAPVALMSVAKTENISVFMAFCREYLWNKTCTVLDRSTPKTLYVVEFQYKKALLGVLRFHGKTYSYIFSDNYRGSLRSHVYICIYVAPVAPVAPFFLYIYISLKYIYIYIRKWLEMGATVVLRVLQTPKIANFKKQQRG